MVSSEINIILIAFIVVIVLLILYFIFKKDLEPEEDIETDEFSLEYLKEVVKGKISEKSGENIYERKITRKEAKKREQLKARLNKASRCCAQGNIGERDYMKDTIKGILQDDFKINEATIDNVLPFGYPKDLTAKDKFEILYAIYNKDKKNKVFSILNDRCKFDREKRNKDGSFYEVSEEDIHEAYEKLSEPLSYVDKIEVVAQKIYQDLYGNSVADILRYDLTIDGVSGGVSGASSEQYNFMEEAMAAESGTKREMSYNSLWIFFHGKAIKLSFLKFRDEKDLVRVCKNLYRHGSVGHLTSKIGYKLSYQADGSRVVVIRPKMSTHWAFFLRKFDSAKNMSIDKLLIHENNEVVIILSKWASRGCLNIIISGDQNSGKTTFFKALASFFDRRNPIRTLEQEFEVWLNNAYTDMNCVCLRASDDVPLYDVIAIAKKMDAAIMILGEIGNFEHAGGYLSLTQCGTRSVAATIHTNTTDDLIDYMVSGGMYTKLYSNEVIAAEKIAKSIQLDIHWVKTPEGIRYPSYINEIVPLSNDIEDDGADTLTKISNSLRLQVRKKAYEVRPLVEFEDGKFVIKNIFSDASIERIVRNLSKEDAIEFKQDMDRLKALIENKGGK